MSKYFKWILIIGFVLLVWLWVFGDGICQSLSTQEKILTEIAVDIRYIKESLAEIRIDNRETKLTVLELERRVGSLEHKTTSFEQMICEITERNNWFMGIIGAMLITVLGLQYKRSYMFREGNIK